MPPMLTLLSDPRAKAGDRRRGQGPIRSGEIKHLTRTRFRLTQFHETALGFTPSIPIKQGARQVFYRRITQTC